MRFFLRMLLILALALVAQWGFHFPWWSVAVAGFLGALIVRGNSSGAFFSGLFAIAILWAVWAYQIDQASQSILSEKIDGLFMLEGKPWALLLLTGLVGGLAGAFGALSGWAIRGTKKKPRRSPYYRG